ncbi:MAG: hypothetical protein V4750_14200 [Pseudomonadota bacterium]
MTTHTLARSTSLAVAAVALCVAWPALAQTAPAKKPAPAKVVKKAPGKAAPAEPAPPAAATPEQVDAAERVYYGLYDCEFKQTIDIVASPKYPSYVDVKHGKADYLMKPVLSSTGAIRLEDLRGDTLMVQISSKSMLLNVKTAQRIVDDCVSPKQRELIEQARVAKAAAAAASAAPSAPVAPAASAAEAASAPAAAMTTTIPEPQTK